MNQTTSAAVAAAFLILSSMPGIARAACAPGERFAVEVETTACEAQTPRTLLLETRIHRSVTLGPFLQNCPQSGIDAYDAESPRAQTYLYSSSVGDPQRGCAAFPAGEKRWMMANAFCCENSQNPSQACLEGWQRLEHPGDELLAYLHGRGLIETSPDLKRCGADSAAYQVRLQKCAALDATQGVEIEARVLAQIDFAPWPHNCPLPERQPGPAGDLANKRFVHPLARDCDGFGAGRELWVYSRGVCCENPRMAGTAICEPGVRQIVESERNHAIEQFLVERGYKEPASH